MIGKALGGGSNANPVPGYLNIMNHTEDSFRGTNGIHLYYQYWLPANEPRAILLIVHGLAEHSGRYMNIVNHFVPKGFAIYGFDLPGHGKSEGLRGYIERFSCFLDNLDAFLDVVRSRHHNSKIFIMGHSMGGTIATAYAVQHQHKFDGLIVSGATLFAGSSISPLQIILAKIFSLLLPKIGITVIDASAISRDEAVVNNYVNDPLVYRGKIRARLGAEFIRTMQVLPRQMPDIALPILIMHGTADRLSNPKSSELLYERASSDDKTLKLYTGFYHEIFNEPGREQVFADMESWLTTHI